MKPTLRAMMLYFFRLGSLVWGGPVVLCEHMRRDLVEHKRWVSPEEYAEGLALSQMAPGPLATQLAIYLGWVRGGVPWATMAGLAFVIPSFLMVVGIAVFYLSFGPWIRGAFYGVGAAVIAVMVMSSYKLFRKTFHHDIPLWIVGTLSAAATVATESEWVWLFLAAGLAIVVHRRFTLKTRTLALPAWFITGLYGPATNELLGKIFLFFLKAGAFVFGSGLAVVPFLHGGIMENHWLTERQFLDAVAIAMITPGPVVITVAFIGFLVAGFAGAILAALGVFLPCYLFVVVPAPYFSRIAKNQTVRAFIDGITAAAVGAIAGATVVLGKRAIVDWLTLLLFAGTLLALAKAKRIPEPILILLAGAVGVLVH